MERIEENITVWTGDYMKYFFRDFVLEIRL